MPRQRNRHLIALALALAIAATVSACGNDSPVDASGQALAQNDPNRYLPHSLLGARIRKLAQHEQDAVRARLEPYGLDGWLSDVKVGLRSFSGEDMDPAPAVVVVGSTKRDDPDMLSRLGTAWSGPGEQSDQEWIDVDGRRVLTGRLINSSGRYQYIAWQANPEIAVSIISKTQSAASGWEPVEGMREEIAYATS